MTKAPKRIVVGLGMGLMAATALHADDRVYIGAAGIGTTPAPERDAEYALGAAAHVGFPLNRLFALELNGHGYTQRRESDPTLYDTGGGVGLDLVLGDRDVHEGFQFLAGGGALFEEAGNDNFVSPYANAGAAYRQRVTEGGIAVRLEARVVAVFNDEIAAGEDILLDGRYHLGLEFPLGARDTGPAPATVYEPTAPDLAVIDNDGDGVPDARDQCPQTLPNVSVNPRGCDLDRDQDGIIDARDRCPDTPESVAVNFDGCTLDQDSDGVADNLDDCLGTLPGFPVDANGCTAAGSRLLETVTFEGGADEIRYNARTLLDDVVKLMVRHPDLQVDVVGHSDNAGGQGMNLKLSRQRAEAVRDHLVREGISSGRLHIEALGEFQPVADNSTPDGRARNRRVEIKVRP